MDFTFSASDLFLLTADFIYSVSLYFKRKIQVKNADVSLELSVHQVIGVQGIKGHFIPLHFLHFILLHVTDNVNPHFDVCVFCVCFFVADKVFPYQPVRCFRRLPPPPGNNPSKHVALKTWLAYPCLFLLMVLQRLKGYYETVLKACWRSDTSLRIWSNKSFCTATEKIMKPETTHWLKTEPFLSLPGSCLRLSVLHPGVHHHLLPGDTRGFQWSLEPDGGGSQGQ